MMFSVMCLGLAYSLADSIAKQGVENMGGPCYVNWCLFGLVEQYSLLYPHFLMFASIMVLLL